MVEIKGQIFSRKAFMKKRGFNIFEEVFSHFLKEKEGDGEEKKRRKHFFSSEEWKKREAKLSRKQKIS